MTASTLRWPLFALIGLMVAIAVALLANRLVGERIGISSESITAGESLSPKHAHHDRRGQRRSEAPVPAQTTSTAPGHTPTVPGGGSSSEDGSDGDGSDRAQRDDPKARGRLPSASPPPASPTPTPTTPSGQGSDTSTEPGDD